MKFVSTLLLICAVSFSLSCSKSSNNSGTTPHDCDFSLPNISAYANGTVKYDVTLTGTGKVTQIVYKTETADSVVASPTIPFEVSLPVTSGTAISLSTKGNTSGGTISIQYAFTPTSGTSITKNESSCGN